MSTADTLRFVLGDQLSRNLSSLRDLDPHRDVVFMAEVSAECTYVRHHKKKIAFILSAMRHFAAELREEGVRVAYRCLDDPENRGDFQGELAAAVQRFRPRRVVVTEPGEWRVLEDMRGWEQALGVPVEIRRDDRFLTTPERFRDWAQGRKTLRMEYFYREMRRETGLLMAHDGGPEGGTWNFDKENRKALKSEVAIPKPVRFSPDATTKAVLDLVAREFGSHFGDLEEFGYAVTREDALGVLQHFIRHALSRFGDYQDAMKEGEPTLFHSVLSPYLNVGLLGPMEVCQAVEGAYEAGRAPLNAVEGFIRQVIGWREYIRGIYWLFMPDYPESNYFQAARPLPDFYWTGETDLNCLRQCIHQTRREAYAHHIQRLMVTGNFALLAGLSPREVEDWYLSVYVDAFEWVELPNTHGMALFADGGILASKPYAASGKYIQRMSDYCRRCRYDPGESVGPDACPFNFLYWDFLARERERLGTNPRMALMYGSLDGMDEQKVEDMRRQAAAFLRSLETRHP